MVRNKTSHGLPLMAGSLWLVRPRTDGGNDYVNFVRGLADVEMREGSHLPPQMPLLKRRCRLQLDEAERQRHALLQQQGFRCSEPLF
ncbi:MAG: hypothetical protein RLZZ32_2117 [Cyanobacteriota bacterium]|jgi:hypothetical protein